MRRFQSSFVSLTSTVVLFVHHLFRRFAVPTQDFVREGRAVLQPSAPVRGTHASRWRSAARQWTINHLLLE